MKEEIKINDVRVSPYALKRKRLVELLIINDKIKGISHFTVIKIYHDYLEDQNMIKDCIFAKSVIVYSIQKKNWKTSILHYV